MESTRQKKISSLIQQELSLLFQRKSNEFLNKIITVTVVRVSPDLGYAKVFISIFPEEKKEEVFEMIELKTANIRYELGNKIRNQVRKIPELQFFIDDSLEYAAKIDQLLKK